MKALKSNPILWLTVLLGVILVSCSENTVDPEDMDKTKNNYEFMVVEFQAGNIYEADLENELKFESNDVVKSHFDLTDVLLDMRLSKEQLDKIEIILKVNRSETAVLINDFNLSQQEIIDGVNKVRETIIYNYEEGNIDYEEALHRLSKLDDTAYNIISKEVIIEYENKLFNQRYDMAEEIRSLLDEEQLVVWREFVSQNILQFFGQVT